MIPSASRLPMSMRILHLAFEDHRRPGSGGGSLRNREINIRLAAAGHDVHVVTASYPGARGRIEDGVHYRQCGLRWGTAPSLLSHQARLPLLVRSLVRDTAPDVIVEEFAPLASSLGVGHWSDRPTVGVAQGFFAAEKARQYHLPAPLLTGIQTWGTRSHDHLIGVSEDVAGQLSGVAPGVPVTVIPNGVDMVAADAARAATARPHARAVPQLLFLGRLEIAQKGLDVLLAAIDRLRRDVRLTIAGAGKDLFRIEREIAARGLGRSVTLTGPVHGDAKWRLIAGADLLLLPSRYETFGITALEAMACGTPVVATDLACLRELVPASAGTLLPREDPCALARAIDGLIASPARRARMGACGPGLARAYSWDAIAEAQAGVYRSTLAESRSWVTV